MHAMKGVSSDPYDNIPMDKPPLDYETVADKVAACFSSHLSTADRKKALK